MAGNKNSGGRNAKSARLHILQGTFRSDRFTGDAPNPPLGNPAPPRRLTGAARAEWGRMLERLRQSRILSTIDDGALLQVAETFSDVVRLEKRREDLHATGRALREEVQKKLEGERLVEAVRQIAALERLALRVDSELRQQRQALRAWYLEFGLTPSARTRVKVAPETKRRSPEAQRFLAGVFGGDDERSLQPHSGRD